MLLGVNTGGVSDSLELLEEEYEDGRLIRGRSALRKV